jgi:hypothetical protein
MEIQLKVIGVVLVLLSLIHIIFPRYFDWAKEFDSLSLVNRQMIYVHTFFIALVVFLMGLLCIIAPVELMTTRLGKIISCGLTIFWAIRLFVQFFGYSPLLWKGKKFETIVHIVFSLLWTYFTTIFFIISWRNI